jgi:hypothetical protein
MNDDTNTVCADAAIAATPFRPLLELLLSDAATDIEVVTRELGLSDKMRERLRRALDRIECAQSVLEAMGGRWVAGTIKRGGSEGLDDAGCVGEGAAERVTSAVKLLAEGWPQDYPDRAVEWEILSQSG